VLPICIGQATRITQFITDATKAYRAEVQLGISTDTFDRQGQIIHRGDVSGITITQIRKVLAQFQGIIAQTPPVYSALKHNGKRYYELARAGLPVNPKPRQVEISRIDLVNFQIPFLTIKVECSKGTYIRSLAQDIGTQLGCYAHLTNLTRLRCGTFSIEAAHPLDQIAAAQREGKLESILYPMDTPLLDLETLIASKKIEAAIVNGQSIPLDNEHEQIRSDRYCRAYNLDGEFIAILRFIPETGLWHPTKVFGKANIAVESRYPESLTTNL